MPKGSKSRVRQDVWSKKEQRLEEVEARKLIGLNDKYADKPYKSVFRDWLKHQGNGKVVDMDYWEQDGKRYYVDGKNVKFEPSAREREVAEILSKKFGKFIQLNPRVDNPEGIRTPDYFINGRRYDLKEIEGVGKNVIDGNLRKSKTQADHFVLDFTKSKLSTSEIERQLTDIYRSGRRGLITSILIRGDDVFDIIVKKDS